MGAELAGELVVRLGHLKSSWLHQMSRWQRVSGLNFRPYTIFLKRDQNVANVLFILLLFRAFLVLNSAGNV